MLNPNLGTVQNAPGKEFVEHLPKYVEALSKASWTNLESALEQLNEGSLTLGALGLLAAKSLSSEFGNHVDEFLIQITAFFQNADAPQFRYCPAVCKWIWIKIYWYCLS